MCRLVRSKKNPLMPERLHRPCPGEQRHSRLGSPEKSRWLPAAGRGVAQGVPKRGDGGLRDRDRLGPVRPESDCSCTSTAGWPGRPRTPTARASSLWSSVAMCTMVGAASISRELRQDRTEVLCERAQRQLREAGLPRVGGPADGEREDIARAVALQPRAPPPGSTATAPATRQRRRPRWPPGGPRTAAPGVVLRGGSAGNLRDGDGDQMRQARRDCKPQLGIGRARHGLGGRSCAIRILSSAAQKIRHRPPDTCGRPRAPAPGDRYARMPADAAP
jgi:hypothetical protein